jgi:RNA polymerase sigma-70 factor (ECF subfamily)
MSDGFALAPETWVDQHGDALYRFALLWVSDPERADDLVQETFLEGLRARSSFSGKSSVRTWLTAILKHKIVDSFRRSRREPRIDDEPQRLVHGDGSSVTARCRPGDEPGATLERREFWEVLEYCLRRLPEHLADAFVAIEIGALKRQCACDRLGITAANLSVRLYRARSMLRRCRELHQFRFSRSAS